MPQEKLVLRVPQVSQEKQDLLEELVRPALQELRELRDFLGPQVKVELRVSAEKQELVVRLERQAKQE